MDARMQTYVVRVWLEPSQGGPVWRASVTDSASGKKRYFSDPESLTEYLRLQNLGAVAKPGTLNAKR